MKAEKLAHVRRNAASLRDAMRQRFDEGSRPTAERLGFLALVDALDRVLLALGDTTESPLRTLDAARAELRQATASALPFLPNEIRLDLDELGKALEDVDKAPRGFSHRAGSPLRTRKLASSGGPLGGAPHEARVAAKSEPLRFGATAPQGAAPGDHFVARFVAYTPAEAASAAAALGELSSPGRHVGPANAMRGSEVCVALSGEGLRIEGEASARQQFRWEGGCVVLEFGVEVLKKPRMSSTLLKFDISIDGFLLARVRLALKVGRGSAGAPAQQCLDRLPARSAFASYSSQDRERVLDRVAAIRIATGTDVFLDCYDLRPGEKWAPALAREIDTREAFMLFWSRAAADSRWVTWEWERALAAKGLDAIQIHPLENAVPVPRALESVHVGDPYMDLRTATAARRAEAAFAPEGERT